MKSPFLAASLLLLLAASGFAQAAGDGADAVSLQFPNNPVADILTTYETLSGKTLIRDANLAGPNLTIVSPRRLPKAEALRLIESALLLNGYSLIPGPDNTVKVVNFTGGKAPRAEGLPLFTSLADLPIADQVVSYYMPLQFISAADAAPIFQGSVALHPYGAIVPVPSAQAIVVTENSATIRQVAKLKDLIDVPPAKVISEFVQLRRADAERVTETLTKLLEAEKKGQPGQAVPGNAPAGAAGQFENKLVAGEVQFVADARTNRILVITRPVNFAYVKGLIEQFDQSVDVMEPFSRPLKYVSAADMLPVLQNLLAESKDDATGGTGTGSNASTRSPQTTSHTPINNTSTSTTGGGSDLQSRLSDQPDDVPPQAIIIGKTRLIADNKTNSILVIGPPESVSKVRGILDKLDVRPKQVYLATVIGKLNLTNSSELSVDLLQNYAGISGNNGVATSSMNSQSLASPRLDPRSLASAGAFPFIGGVTLYGAIGHTLNYYVRALESTGRFTVLSRPSVYTANNKKASISSGQQVPVPQSTLSSLDTVSNNNVTQQSTIEYKNVELLLEVIPLINSEKEVTLQISQQNNNIAGSSTISGNTVPTIASDNLETTVTVPNKQTIILGGLIRDQDTTDRTGVPLLKDIPFLGALFRSDTKQRERDELVILIEPTVVETDDELAEAEKAEKAKSSMGAAATKYADKPTSVINGKSTALESLTH